MRYYIENKGAAFTQEGDYLDVEDDCVSGMWSGEPWKGTIEGEVIVWTSTDHHGSQRTAFRLLPMVKRLVVTYHEEETRWRAR